MYVCDEREEKRKLKKKRIKWGQKTEMRDTKMHKIFRSETPLEGPVTSASTTPRATWDKTNREKRTGLNYWQLGVSLTEGFCEECNERSSFVASSPCPYYNLKLFKKKVTKDKQ